MRIVLFYFETLPACSLGCYGEWKISTPEIDSIASRSTVFQNYFHSPGTVSLPGLIAKKQPVSLVTDDEQESDFRSDFSNAVRVEPGQVMESDAIRDLLESGSEILCLHISSPPVSNELLDFAEETWLRETIREWQFDESDESEPVPPKVMPKEALTQPLAEHVAHVMACDAILSEWLERFEDVLELGDVIVLTSGSGDERRVTDVRPDWIKSVSEPIVHLPLIVYRIGDEEQHRIEEAVTSSQAAEFIAVAADQFYLSKESEEKLNAGAAITYQSTMAIAHRTADWLYVEKFPSAEQESEASAERQAALFRKPEDVWEVYDVAGQFPELIEEIQKRTGPGGLSGTD